MSRSIHFYQISTTRESNLFGHAGLALTRDLVSTNFGLKNIDIRYNHYDRNDGLQANIVTIGVKFVEQ
jgi:hypothetical protein